MEDDVVRIWVSRAHLADLGWHRHVALYDPDTRVIMGTVEDIADGRAGGVVVTVRPNAELREALRTTGRGVVLTWVAWDVAWPGELKPGQREWLDHLRSRDLI